MQSPVTPKFDFFQGNPRLNLAFMANLFHTIPGLDYTVADMDTVRLTEELNTALSRYSGPIIGSVVDCMSVPVLCEILY